MKKRLLSAVMASAMVLSLAACGGAKTETTAAETTAEKKEETTTAGTTAAETAEAAGGTLIVGFDQDFPPMGFVGDNGEYTGFDLDLAKEVASRLGLEYKAQRIAGTPRIWSLNPATSTVSGTDLRSQAARMIIPGLHRIWQTSRYSL